MKIAICVPSRGLIFSRTVESIIKGMQELRDVWGTEVEYFTSHELPIPDCHNSVTEQALNWGADRIIFIEEDMYVEPAAFLELAGSSEEYLTLDYNDKNGSPNGIIHYDFDGNILWAGLGATSVDTSVFKTLGQPYFRADVRYSIKKKAAPNGKKIVTEFTELETRSPYGYGGLDVDFCFRIRNLGIQLHKSDKYRAAHFALVKLGEPHTNQGCHEIKTV